MVCGLRKRVYGHLLGVNFGLRCEKHILENQRVQWFTDNKKVCSIVKKGFIYFFCGSFMFLFCLVFAMFCARLFICASWSPAGKGLTSWLWFVVSSVSLSLSHWYPGSGVVLDCIDSWSLQPYLLSMKRDLQNSNSAANIVFSIEIEWICRESNTKADMISNS